MSTDAPKSSLDLVMERLRKQDAEAGITPVSLNDAQREAIGEAKRVHESRVAQRRIMHDSAVASTFDPAERAEREQELRRDLDRFDRELETKLEGLRRGQ